MIVKTHEDTKKLLGILDDIFVKKNLIYLDIEFGLEYICYPEQKMILNESYSNSHTYYPDTEVCLYEFPDYHIAPIRYDGFPQVFIGGFSLEGSPEDIRNSIATEVIANEAITSGLAYRFLDRDIEKRYNEENSALKIKWMEGICCFSSKLLGYFMPVSEEKHEMEGETTVKEFIKVPDHIIKLKDY